MPILKYGCHHQHCVLLLPPAGVIALFLLIVLGSGSMLVKTERLSPAAKAAQQGVKNQAHTTGTGCTSLDGHRPAAGKPFELHQSESQQFSTASWAMLVLSCWYPCWLVTPLFCNGSMLMKTERLPPSAKAAQQGVNQAPKPALVPVLVDIPGWAQACCWQTV
jgi:hypothetical protein